MSLKTILVQQVITGLLQSGLITKLIDDDIALIESVARYADERIKNITRETALVPDSAEAALKAAAYEREQGIKGDPAGAGGNPAGASILLTAGPANALGAEAPHVPNTDEEQAALPLGDIDRGPEPQDLATVLDTRAPAVADDTVLDGGEHDPRDPPPDYTKLSAIKA